MKKTDRNRNLYQKQTGSSWPLKTFLILVVAALLFRLPYLVNPERMNSDHAFLGIQGNHILKGEWSWFLWGSDYQASWEPLVGAFLFLFFGPTFQALQGVPLLGFVLTLLIFFDLARREIGTPKASLLSFFWIGTSRPFIEYNILPYRQWSIFFCLASLWCAYHAHHEKRAKRRSILWGFAGFFPFFALYVDFVTIQLTLPLVIYAGFWSYRSGFVRSLGTGFLSGAVLLAITRFLGPVGGAPLAFSFKTLIHNLGLFWTTCFPVLMGFPFPADSHGRVALQTDFAWALLAALTPLVIVLIFSLFLIKKHFWEKEGSPDSVWLGVFGFLAAGNSAMGFLGSSMASDVHSVRYLPPLLYALPFALIPAAAVWNRRKIFPVLLPALIFLAWGGWQQATPYVQKNRIIRDPGGWVHTAQELREWVNRRNISFGYSDYWTAYQLTFLYNENPAVIPRDPVIDRYPTHRALASRAERVVEIFTPADPRSEIARVQRELEKKGKLVDKWEQNGFVALIREN